MRRPPVLPLMGSIALLTVTAVMARAGWGRGALPFQMEALPAPELGIGWSARVLFADAARDAGLRQLLRVLAVVGAVAGGVALAGLAFRMAGRGLEARREMAVRGALGAYGRQLLVPLIRPAAPVLLAGALAGALLGCVALVAMAASWSGPAATMPAGSTAAMAIVCAIGVLMIVAPLVIRPARHANSPAPLLAVGSRATADRFEGSARSLLIGAQMTATLALLAGGFTILRTMSPSEGSSPPRTDIGTLLVVPLSATAPSAERWAQLDRRLATLPGVAPESIASVGAWWGLGTRDLALADCGICVIGGIPVRFHGEMAHHHAVSAGYFADAGLAITDGRGFDDAADGPGAPPVAVVSRSFARANFQPSGPVGRVLRVGGSPDAWYRVIGVVEDVSVPALGRGTAAPTVYLSAAQHPPDRADLAVRVLPGADLDAADRAIAAAGFLPLGGWRTADQHRAVASEPIRWWSWMIAWVALAALIFAVQSVHEMARIDAGARRREMAIRRALGSSDAQILRPALLRIVRIALVAAVCAAPFAVGVGAALDGVAAGVPIFDAPVYFGLMALLATAGVLGALRPVLAGARVHPAEVLAE